MTIRMTIKVKKLSIINAELGSRSVFYWIIIE